MPISTEKNKSSQLVAQDSKTQKIKLRGCSQFTSERKEKAERSSEIDPAIAMNLLFLISLSHVTLSLRVVNAPPPELLPGVEEEEVVTIDSLLLLKVLGRRYMKTEEEMRWW